MTDTSPTPLHVLFAASEMAPLATVGGLAAAAAGLVKELRRQGVTVTVVLPDYAGGELEREIDTPLSVPDWAAPCTARAGAHPDLGPIVLLDVPGIRKPHPYVQSDGQGWPDNDQRFFAFSAGVASLANDLRPDVVHLNDWHTATAIAHLNPDLPTVFTIHTLGYQGQADPGWNLSFPHHAERFIHGDSLNPLVGAVRCADRIIAVSPHYADEIRTAEFGFGVEDELLRRGEDLVGILNGIDDTTWDPGTDHHIAATFTSRSTAGKAECRAALREQMGLAEVSGVVIGVVTRLVDQKGVDLVLEVVPYLAGMGAQLAVLGSGDRALVDALQAAADRQPERVAFVNGYDEALAHRIFAGCDLFAMPSRFEPCGLAQMQAMRYGALPVVTPVGGLVDTVIDADTSPADGTGIVAGEVSAAALVDALHRGVRLASTPARRNAARRRGMNHDWSWRSPAARHVEMYAELASRR